MVMFCSLWVGKASRAKKVMCAIPFPMPEPPNVIPKIVAGLSLFELPGESTGAKFRRSYVDDAIALTGRPASKKKDAAKHISAVEINFFISIFCVRQIAAGAVAGVCRLSLRKPYQ